MSDNTQQRLAQAYQHLQTGNRQAAFDILNPILQTDPNNVDAWWLMANTVTNPQYIETALNNVLSLNPRHAGAQQMLDQLRQQQNASASPWTQASHAGSPAVDVMQGGGYSTPQGYGPQPQGYGPQPQGYGPPAGAPAGAPMPDALPVKRASLLNILLGTLLGVIGAALAGAGWVLAVALTERQYVYAAILVGLVIGGAVALGAGRRRNILLAFVAALITLVTMPVTEYFIIRHFVIQDLAAEGVGMELVDQFMPGILEVVQVSIQEDPITLLFWALAVGAAFFVALGLGQNRRR